MTLHSYDGMHVMVGGVLCRDDPEVLLKAAAEWRECAWSVVRSGQEDTDPILRSMAALMARYRLRIARALKNRAAEKRRRIAYGCTNDME